MAISESRVPFMLRSLMLAEPHMTLLSSTIMSFEWTYTISVTGSFVLGLIECVLSPTNVIYSDIFFMFSSLYIYSISDRPPRKRLKYSQCSYIFMTLLASESISPSNPGNNGMTMTTWNGWLFYAALFIRWTNACAIWLVTGNPLKGINLVHIVLLPASEEMKNWFSM